ncbi:Uncharacterized protein HZ326_30430 [Fusarium oxysporum f. sp. albedinis]|nr:Uncharacterized protein HZ326_30430 [Fusarium oxysporum f. sp. albedinis]
MCAVVSESHQLVFFLGDEAKSKEGQKLMRKLGKYNRSSLPPLYSVVTIWSLLFTEFEIGRFILGRKFSLPLCLVKARHHYTIDVLLFELLL